MADSPFFTVTGEEKLYSKRSPASRPEAVEAMVEKEARSLKTSPSKMSAPAFRPDPNDDFAIIRAIGGGAAGAAFATKPPTTPPSNTCGAAARLSASSALGREMYFGAYNCVMNEIGRPETTESRTLFQSSPEVLSTMAQPSKVGSP